ncbi:hypothetical protein CQ062_16245 [Ochrobactrum sp. MYb68]|nr:hypothetical protein CQ062_16245 [Ochrobactrum sp. MYb68]
MSSFTRKVVMAAALSSSVVSANASQITQTEAEKPTIVLVHGAFADGSTWRKVIPLLQQEGLNVVAVQNPLTSLADDVATTRRALDAQTGPVVLVGHSWGGAVITEAGEHERVKALVYVAAFAPSQGQSVVDMSKNYPTPSGFAHINADKEGYLTLTAEGVANHLAQDLPAEETKVMTALQGPVRGTNFEDKVKFAAWTTRPSTYIISEDDRMLQPELQKEMAKKISAKVVSLKAGHAPHLSHPNEVAKVILEVVSNLEN